MSEFEKSEWAENRHAQEFIKNADNYILERKRLLKILESFFTHIIVPQTKGRSLKVLDLGCGNGALSSVMVKCQPNLRMTLVDGSRAMLENAQRRFKEFDNFEFVLTTFQNLINQDELVSSSDYDFIISSLAIHHLLTSEKKSFYQFIYNNLNPGGYFLNIDTIRAPVEELEDWYRVLWSEWIRENEKKWNMKESFANLPGKYKNNPDNHPDQLKVQLEMLRTVGFKNVDCYYKYGIFAMFGGKK